MSEKRKKHGAAFWMTVALGVAVFVVYPLSYPWAQCATISAAMTAATKGERLPDWVDQVGTKFYAPLGWGISIMPQFVLQPYRAYNEWCLERSGIDFANFIQ